MADELLRGKGLDLRFDAGSRGLIAIVEPAPDALPIDEVWLRERIAAQGYGKYRYLPAAATLLLGQYNSGTRVAGLRLAEAVDASFSLALSADSLSASLVVTPAEGGAALAAEAVLEALLALGVQRGVDEAALAAAMAPDAAGEFVVARGTPPVDGEDGRFEKLLPEIRSREPHIDASGRIDYRDLGEILVVHPGDLLLCRHPATEGTAGTTLLGQPIPARPGRDIVFAGNLDGVRIDPDNANVLVAAISGQPVSVPGGMRVEPVYAVDGVGTASGNINFDGNVLIKGDVASGMTVIATGDIEVGGMVEAATLQAGGNIVVKGGVVGNLGRKESGEVHVIRCGASFSAAFAQQAHVEAGDSIFIDDTAMQSELIADHYVVVGGKKRGNVIGGRIHATLSVTAKVLGSPNRVTTHIEIGINPALHKQMLEMAHTRDARETKLLEVSKVIEFTRQHPERVNAEMLQKVHAAAAALSADIAALREAHEDLNRKIRLSLESRVTATQAMYEGVEVHMGAQRFRVAGERGPGTIGMGKNGLVLQPVDGMTAD